MNKFWDWFLWVGIAATADAGIRQFVPLYPHLYLGGLAFAVVLNVGRHLGKLEANTSGGNAARERE